jgi:serine/threonine protein kinase
MDIIHASGPVIVDHPIWRPIRPLVPGDPRTIGAARVRGRLGEGGMGVVYLADHDTYGTLAIKVIRSAMAADHSFRARFRHEVETANRVRHPRIARIVAADPNAATPWLATEFIDGPTLAETVAQGPLKGQHLEALAVALADTLTAIHSAQVVHRDLKPANILLTPRTPVVIDFGIATTSDTTRVTATELVVGTPGWMAPEQLRTSNAASTAGEQTSAHQQPADVFAWGMVIAYAAAGSNPFGRGRGEAINYRIVHEPPDLPNLPPPLDYLVRWALAKDSGRRPTAEVLLARLTQHSEPATLAETVQTLVAVQWDASAFAAATPISPIDPGTDLTDVPEPPSDNLNDDIVLPTARTLDQPRHDVAHRPSGTPPRPTPRAAPEPRATTSVRVRPFVAYGIGRHGLPSILTVAALIAYLYGRNEFDYAVATNPDGNVDLMARVLVALTGSGTRWILAIVVVFPLIALVGAVIRDGEESPPAVFRFALVSSTVELVLGLALTAPYAGVFLVYDTVYGTSSTDIRRDVGIRPPSGDYAIWTHYHFMDRWEWALHATGIVAGLGILLAIVSLGRLLYALGEGITTNR